jgi:hypothetical protein
MIFPLSFKSNRVITQSTIPVPINLGDKEAKESIPDH